MLGTKLREAREAARLSQGKAATQLLVSAGALSKYENNKLRIPRDLTQRADDLFHTGGALERSWIQAHDSGVVSDSGVPDSAPLVPHVLPNGEVKFVPANRRDFLKNVGIAAASAFLSSIPAASAGAAEAKPLSVFQAAHRHLIDMDNTLGSSSALPGVRDQIRSLVSLRQAMGPGRDSTELLHMQARFSELAGWLYEDQGDFEQAQYWMDRAVEWSAATGDTELISYVFARKSQLAGDMGHAGQAVDLAHAADMQAPNGRISAIAYTYAAHGYALGGSLRDTEHGYEQAREAAAAFDGASPWGAWLDHSYIDVHRARSLTALGRPVEAAATFRGAIEQLPDGYHRDRGVYLAREALAHARARDVHAAVRAGTHALVIARDTRSGRTVTELRSVERELRGQGAPAQEFRDAMREALIA